MQVMKCLRSSVRLEILVQVHSIILSSFRSWDAPGYRGDTEHDFIC